jgi:hypothetical protein
MIPEFEISKNVARARSLLENVDDKTLLAFNIQKDNHHETPSIPACHRHDIDPGRLRTPVMTEQAI